MYDVVTFGSNNNCFDMTHTWFLNENKWRRKRFHLHVEPAFYELVGKLEEGNDLKICDAFERAHLQADQSTSVLQFLIWKSPAHMAQL